MVGGREAEGPQGGGTGQDEKDHRKAATWQGHLECQVQGLSVGTGLSLHSSPTPFTPKVAPESGDHLHLPVPPSLTPLAVSLGNPKSTPPSLCLDAPGAFPADP